MTDETNIRRLDATTVQRIAAGEIVERPASVVKELVENSIDADANRIDVTVENGGTDRIVVSDDGVGMNEADLRIAVEEHTTSKIEDIDDLESGVATLGFRGEALHTIAAVARATITSKPRGGEEATELRMHGGEVESVGPAGRPEGTTVEVADLFYNTPARRKYLKTTATEFSHVNTVVTRYALANPDVAVSLTHDDREIFATTGRGDLQSALLSVYGREVATSMISVDGTTDSVSVSGYVSDPETTRSSREYLSTYVNGRYVRSPIVREAVLSAYGGQLSTERYPFAVLFLDVPADGVDVNVHPRKMEVRWDDEPAVKEAVETAAEEALLDHGLVRSSAPRGRSAPDEARVTPDKEQAESEREGPNTQSKLVDSDEREQATLDEGQSDEKTAERAAEASGGSGIAGNPTGSGTAGTPTGGRTGETTTETTTGTTETTADTTATTGDSDATETAPTTTTDTAETATTSETTETAPATTSDATATTTASETTETAPATTSDATATTATSETTETATTSETTETASATTTEAPSNSATTEAPSNSETTADRKFSAPTKTKTLAGDPATGPEFDTLPQMRILGQLHDTYLVAETPDGLVLVDQHAADERVNYERLRESFADDATTQMLATPVELELTAGEAAVFETYREPLARLGFRAELTDNRTVAVRTSPTVFDATLDPELLRDALAEFVSTDPDDRGDTVDAVADDLLADLACYPSITGNTSLTEGSVVDLLGELDDCENPYACPHGRPVIIEFGEDEIEDRFERDYPGHAGRREE